MCNPVSQPSFWLIAIAKKEMPQIYGISVGRIQFLWSVIVIVVCIIIFKRVIVIIVVIAAAT